MWSPFVLCLLVGFAYASTAPAWKDGTEYVYSVKGRTLSSLHEAANQYSGIFLTAKLSVTLRSDGKLQGKIADAQYAQIHSLLPNGWESEVPESQLSYKPLPLSQKPFQMVLEDGLIVQLTVEKELANWEANMIRSIVSQLQWDVQGKSAIDSPINSLPSNERFDGVFKVMEETVTGKTETLYEIHPLPKYLLHSEKGLPVEELQEGEQVVEVIKSKNYTNAEERPSYHYGFAEVLESEPTSNKMGQFFVRESMSRAVLTGQLSNFVIRKAYTVNKIMVNPTFNNKEMGSIVSMVNITLSQLNSRNEEPQDLTNPITIGDVVYTFEDPFATNNNAREKQNIFEIKDDFSIEIGEYMPRSRRALRSPVLRKLDARAQDLPQYQTRPKMELALESPLLPYLTGYRGRSIKENPKFDIQQSVQKIVTEIAEEVNDPQEILRKSTLNKFTILSTLVRVMSEEEIKSLVDLLYTAPSESQERLSWGVFLDAVAEAGTGPAFMIIKELIQSKKIQEFEAAEVIATMAHAVRAPTEDYMQEFFKLIQDSQVREEQYLNETAILAYTDLVYKVYVRRNKSHNQFPVHSFGTFYTKEGRDFIKSTVIPYLSQQLQEAISQPDARKIHVYIRALGNVAYKKILEVFEPYLEGEAQASQFQRMLMVLALDRLVEYNPVVARSVCYKIYQNLGEIPELRVVAVHQIMKTNPPVEMLQRMAESTHTEPQEQVVAAVKSAIESAVHFKSPERQSIQQAAQSAKPLLTKKYYGADYSYICLRDYIMENIDVEFDHKFLEIGSQDHHWPKTLQLALRGNLNGMHHDQLKLSAMSSSISELINVFYRQTDEYQKVKAKRHNLRSGESQWSSANIAELLKYESEEREQLEAVIITEMEHFQKMWSIDNQTLERLPQGIREQEEKLKNGRQFNYTKLRQVDEKALSFPTEMGIPFLFTYDTPLLIKLDGSIRAAATPQISSDNKLHKPDQVSAEVDAKLTVSVRVQSQLKFVTPFDGQVYLAGFDRNIQGHIPIKANAVLDVKNMQAEIKFEVCESNDDVRLFHYSTWPYTSRSDLTDVSPVALRPETQVIRPKVSEHRYFDVVFGKKDTGIALRAWGHHPVQSINFRELLELMQSQGIANMWQQIWDKAVVQQTEANIAFIPSQSSAKKFTLRLAQLTEFKQQPDIPTNEDNLSYSQLSALLQDKEPIARQKEILKHVASGIKSAQLRAYDVSVEFEGDKKYEHILGIAMAKSNAGPKSRTLMYYKKEGEKQKQFAVQVAANISNTNGLDLTYSLRTEPQMQYKFDVHSGENEEEASTITGKASLCRSDARKEYLMQQEPMYQVCKKQMQEGNFQLPACQNLTIQSNYLDEILIEMKHDKLGKESVNIIEGAFKALRIFYYPMTEIQTIQAQEENKVSLKIQYQPENLRQVNFTIRVKDEETRIFNLSIPNEMVKTIVVPHPVFHIRQRLMGVFKGWENFRPTCVIDQTAAQTFSNKTYQMSLEDKYHVAMQFIPRQARLTGETRVSVKELLESSQENYVVLVRQTSAQQKELVITFNHKETQGKTVEINMKPKKQSKRSSGANPAATVLVDNKEMQFTDEVIADLYNGIVQIYALPNGEVKVEFQDAFYLIFDGQRMKLTATGSKLLDSVSGLCGRFSKDQFEDFTVPSKCVVKDPTQFIQSYLVEARRTVPRLLRSGEATNQCVPKVMPLYADVISDRDAGRQGLSRQMDSDIKLRHRYVEDDDKFCFTIRAVPHCISLPKNVVSKKVPVHCIKGSKIAYHLMNQIDQGGNPDFSRKSETKKILMDIPLQCS